jgi:hypothetical protein
LPARVTVREVAVVVREGNVVERPEKIDADTFPRQFMFDAQFICCLDLLRASETQILAVPLKEMKEDHFAQAARCRPVRNTQKGALSSGASSLRFGHDA